MPGGGPRFNAGRPGREFTVEDCRRIDVREWKRRNMLDVPWAGSWFWRDANTLELTASISVLTDPQVVVLSYTASNVLVEEAILLDYTPCGRGGNRVWFRCPGCQRRVAVLLIHRSHFRCRQCHRLPYRTQREDGMGRAWIAQIKLERRLLANWKKPKWMHRVTRDKIIDSVIKLELRRKEILREKVAQYLGAGRED